MNPFEEKYKSTLARREHERKESKAQESREDIHDLKTSKDRLKGHKKGVISKILKKFK